MKTTLPSSVLSGLAALAVLAALFLPTSAGALPGRFSASAASSSPLLNVGQRLLSHCGVGENCLIGHSGPRHLHGWSSPHLALPRSEYRQPDVYLDLGVQSPRYADPDYRMGRPRYVQPPSSYRIRVSPAHVDWCSMRYRSYRPKDNTFQPFNGPRRQCLSPYS
ncbi:BA14K family protein [Pseudaminobacter sp. NGMCC 1.201702]|uniref:BA14K family protein n=1 Tax=Pseudaminobacter sp. NGMCC 1.201702 TaxID=3391825 RepID=UPI0039F08740